MGRYVLTVLLLVALAGVGWIIRRVRKYGWWDEQGSRELVEEFMRKFPGRCMICSRHQFGRNNGYEKNPQPEPHDCIEGKSHA
jgi:hypothetical protein